MSIDRKNVQNEINVEGVNSLYLYSYIYYITSSIWQASQKLITMLTREVRVHQSKKLFLLDKDSIFVYSRQIENSIFRTGMKK